MEKRYNEMVAKGEVNAPVRYQGKSKTRSYRENQESLQVMT